MNTLEIVAELPWIDISLILLFVGLGYALVLKRSKTILQKNTAYNAELLAMRTEIYTEYESNFFTSLLQKNQGTLVK